MNSEKEMYSINGEDFNYTEFEYAVEDLFYDCMTEVNETVTVYVGTYTNDVLARVQEVCVRKVSEDGLFSINTDSQISGTMAKVLRCQ